MRIRGLRLHQTAEIVLSYFHISEAGMLNDRLFAEFACSVCLSELQRCMIPDLGSWDPTPVTL